MFTGHYAAGFALKGLDKRISLGLLFITVQWADILFFLLALAGIEKFEVVKDYLPASHLHLISFPFTHGLVASLLWSAAAFLLFYFIVYRKKRKKIQAALIIATALFSHWLFDLIVHIPDLPILGDNSIKLGFGLWRNAPLSFIVESGFLIIGCIFYMKKTTPTSPWGTYGTIAFLLLLIGANALLIFGPFTVTGKISITLSVMICYALFSGIALLLDHLRK
jgi:hypothetical protein